MAKHREGEAPGTEAQKKAAQEAKDKAELKALEQKLRKQGKIK
jgi:hypothetical protein